MRLTSQRSLKKIIFRTLLCLPRYLPCARAQQLDITCARLSWPFPHNLHLIPLWLMFLFCFSGTALLEVCSKIHAIVCEGESSHL